MTNRAAPRQVARRPRVTVLGSLNIDRIWSVPELPARGQTILANETRTEFGGKGANQAVAAARQGAWVRMVGAVGNDADGDRYREHLRAERIDDEAVRSIADVGTGTAHVYVDARGENQIVVASGANWRVTPEWLETILPSLLERTDILVAQLETPPDAMAKALGLAAAKGICTLLNAAPYTPDFSWPAPIDILVVNEHECRAFFLRTPAELSKMSGVSRGAFLNERRVRNLVVTQGADPTLHFSAEAAYSIPTYTVQPKNTVGAGDTFVGALAVRLAEGADWPEALWQANVAAALSTLASGAQAAMPDRERVDSVGRVDRGAVRTW